MFPPLAREAILLLFLIAPLRFLTLIVILPLRLLCDLFQFLFVPPVRYFYVSLVFFISDPTAVFIPSAFFLVLSVQFAFWRYMFEWRKRRVSRHPEKTKIRSVGCRWVLDYECACVCAACYVGLLRWIRACVLICPFLIAYAPFSSGDGSWHITNDRNMPRRWIIVCRYEKESLRRGALYRSLDHSRLFDDDIMIS